MQLRHDSPLPSRFSIKGILWDINRSYIIIVQLSKDCLSVSRGLIVTEKLRFCLVACTKKHAVDLSVLIFPWQLNVTIVTFYIS